MGQMRGETSGDNRGAESGGYEQGPTAYTPHSLCVPDGVGSVLNQVREGALSEDRTASGLDDVGAIVSRVSPARAPSGARQSPDPRGPRLDRDQAVEIGDTKRGGDRPDCPSQNASPGLSHHIGGVTTEAQIPVESRHYGVLRAGKRHQEERAGRKDRRHPQREKAYVKMKGGKEERRADIRCL